MGTSFTLLIVAAIAGMVPQWFTALELLPGKWYGASVSRRMRSNGTNFTTSLKASGRDINGSHWVRMRASAKSERTKSGCLRTTLVPSDHSSESYVLQRDNKVRNK